MRSSTRRVLLVVLVCALACIATAATTSGALSTQAPLTSPAVAASARTLRQEKDRAKPAQLLKQEPDADEGGDEDADDQLLSATDNNKQPVLEKSLEKPTGRPITRVYDPVTGLFCELEGDCHACPVSEKVRRSAAFGRSACFVDAPSLTHALVARTSRTAARLGTAKRCAVRGRRMQLCDRQQRRPATQTAGSQRSASARACRSSAQVRSGASCSLRCVC